MVEQLKKLFKTNRKYSFEELCRILKYYEKEDIKNELYNLEINGYIILNRDKYQIFPNNFKLVNIMIDKNGCGYFYIDDEIFHIESKNLNGCLDGDLCAVNMDILSVSKIVKRKSNLIICEVKNEKYIIINNNQNYEIILSNADSKKLVEGNVFLVRIKENVKNELYCDLVEVLGHVNEPNIELKEIAISKSFNINFSKQALKQSDEMPTEVSDKDIEGRLDLRDELIYTIDCDETKDMDDAISVRVNELGNYVVGVHISDVSHYVKFGTPLFEEAYLRSTSVYMADTVIPMLTHKLSNGICSLNPNVDRLTISCIVELDKQGNIIDYNIQKSVINSKKKMKYSDVNKILMDNIELEEYKDYIKNLKLANEVSFVLNKEYKNNGYLQFSSDEIKYTNHDNVFEFRKPKAAEKIIESFMLLANKVIATNYAYIPFPFRVHELPDVKDIVKAFETLRKMGYEIPNVLNFKNPKVIQEILKRLYESGNYSLTSYFILKSMKKARYSTINIGHFGLAFNNYTHFTSPIRRFNDLLVHTIISSYLESSKYIEVLNERLPEMCDYISEKEILADEAENEAIKFKMAEYMEDHIGEYFNGKVIDLGSKHVTIKLENNIIGTVFLDNIKDGEYYFDNDTYSIVNKKSKNSYKIGDYIRAKVLFVDKNLRKINLKITENLEHVKTKKLQIKNG